MSGFDVMIGNPPFLGGKKVTGAFGQNHREFLIYAHANGTRGSADYCAYFFLVSFSKLNFNGRMGLIATNTISQGDTREVGLANIIMWGGTIPAAHRDVPWIGAAAVVVNLVTLIKGAYEEPAELDGIYVKSINEYLSQPGKVVGDPYRLKLNVGNCRIGSYLFGRGFLITEKKARYIIKNDPKSDSVLFPCLNGKELNNIPNHIPTRYAINFFNWDKERAMQFSEPWAIVEEKVKPFRRRTKPDGSYVCRGSNPKFYWIYAEKCTTLYKKIMDLKRVMAIALTSKVVMPVWVPPTWVFSHATGVFCYDDDFRFGVLSSMFHWWWAQKYASSMKGDTRYTPSDVFEKFPLPVDDNSVAIAGKALNDHRAPLMIENNEGLTKTYNRVHTPLDTDPGIQKLRELHLDLDIAVRDAYGWSDLDLDHGFHQTRQGIRWTIGPEAQREVLDRLLALNHERYAEEVAQGLHD